MFDIRNLFSLRMYGAVFVRREPNYRATKAGPGRTHRNGTKRV